MMLPARMYPRSVTSRRAEGNARVFALLLLLVFAGGIALFIYRGVRSKTAPPVNVQPPPALSANTQAVLDRLATPVHMRFYSVLDPATVSEDLRAYAEEVGRVLTEYQRQAPGKIQLTVFNSAADTNAQLAAKEGLTAFNREKGNACFLGIAFEQDGNKEILPRLSPAWGQALEADVTRAIERVSSPRAKPNTIAASQPNPGAIEAVKRSLPNISEVTLEEGTQKLRENSLEEFRRTVNEMSAAIKSAEQRARQAQQNGASAELDSAKRELQELQSTFNEKLKEIAARSQAEMEALKQLKQSP